jgi:hypothetical protein
MRVCLVDGFTALAFVFLFVICFHYRGVYGSTTSLFRVCHILASLPPRSFLFPSGSRQSIEDVQASTSTSTSSSASFVLVSSLSSTSILPLVSYSRLSRVLSIAAMAFAFRSYTPFTNNHLLPLPERYTSFSMLLWSFHQLNRFNNLFLYGSAGSCSTRSSS